MKRRAALQSIAIVGGVCGLTIGGYTWYKQNRVPNLEILNSNIDLLGLLVDVIIPPTATPGAMEAGVHKSVIKMVTFCSDIKTQNKFVDGLIDLIDYTKTNFGRTFLDCTPNERIKIVAYFERRDQLFPGIIGKGQRKILGSPFFYTLREYCVKGYFTSEAGATNALRYVLVPAKYIPCQNYLPNEKAWATF